ncbi:hypothetical protein SF123566_1228, partial [Shigella flexneri 1235-66]
MIPSEMSSFYGSMQLGHAQTFSNFPHAPAAL